MADNNNLQLRLTIGADGKLAVQELRRVDQALDQTGQAAKKAVQQVQAGFADPQGVNAFQSNSRLAQQAVSAIGSVSVSAFRTVLQGATLAVQGIAALTLSVINLARAYLGLSVGIEGTGVKGRALNSFLANFHKDIRISLGFLRQFSDLLARLPIPTGKLRELLDVLSRFNVVIGIGRGQKVELLDKIRDSADAAKESLRNLGVVARNVLGDIRENLARFAALAATETIIQVRGVKFESDFADVRKTVEGTEEDIQRLRAEIIRLGDSTSASISDLTQIAATAGQLGLPLQDISRFTELAAKGSVAFNVSADEMAGLLGNLKNQFGLTLEQLSFFADQINHVGDRSNTTERGLLALINRVGGATRNFGLLRSETVALGASILALGKNPELAATGINLLLNRLLSAKTQSAEFQEALKLLGFDLDTLGKRIETGPNEVLQEFLARIEELNPEGRTTILSALIGEAGESKEVVGDLILSLKEYTRLLGVANEQGITGSVDRTFEKRQRTVAASIQLLTNSLNTFAVVASDLFLPTIRAIALAFQGAAIGLREFISAFPNITGFARIAIILGTVATLVRFVFGGLPALVARLLGPLSAALAGVFGASLGVIGSFGARIVAVLGTIFGQRLAAIIAISTLGVSGFTAALAGLSTVLSVIVGNPFVLLLGGLGLLAVRFVAGGAALTALMASVRTLGGLLLRLVGGPIGLLISAIVFAIVKINQFAASTLEFAGKQYKGSQVIQAAWQTIKDVIVGTIQDALIALGNMVGISAKDWDEFKAQASKAWSDIKKSIKNFLSEWQIDWKRTVNFVIAEFLAVPKFVGNALAYLVDTFGNRMDALVNLAKAAGTDIKNALSLKFSTENLSAALDNAVRDEKQSFDNFLAGLKDIGTDFDRDFIGELAGKFGKNLQGTQTPPPEDQRQTREDRGGKALPDGAFGSDGKGRGRSRDTSADDARQIAEANLAIKLEEIAKLEAIANAQYEADRARAEANRARKVAQAQGDQQLILAAENELSAQLEAIERARLTSSRTFAEERLQIQIAAKQAELGRVKDLGEVKQITAEIINLDSQLATVRKTSALAARRLASEEQQSAAERAEANRQLVQDVIEEYDELIRVQREFAADAALIAASNLPLEKKLEWLDKIGKKYQEISGEAKDSNKKQEEITENAARNIQSAFADFLFNPWEKGIKGMALSFAETIRRILAEAVAADILGALGLGGKDNKGGNLAALGKGVLGLFGFGAQEKPAGGEDEIGRLTAIENQKTALLQNAELQRQGIRQATAATEEQGILRSLFTYLFGETQKTAAVTTGQAAQTGAVVTGEAARGAVEKAGKVKSVGVTIASSIKKIHAFAAEAAAGVYASIAPTIPYVGPVLGAIAAGVVYAAIVAFGALTGGAFFAQGGRVDARPGGRQSGSGTSTSDSIPARLSRGEHVIKASSVEKIDKLYGIRFLDLLNENGELPIFKDPGFQINPAVFQEYRLALGGRIPKLNSLSGNGARARAEPPAPAQVVEPRVSIFNLQDKNQFYSAMSEAAGTKIILNALENNPIAANQALGRR